MAKRSRQRRRKKAPGTTTLQQHKQFKKTLRPPLMAVADKLPFESTSWLHERLPEMLWPALIFTQCTEAAFVYFHSLFKFIADHPQKDKMGDLTLTGIAGIEEPLRTELLQQILSIPGAREALRELLRYKSLPMHGIWESHLQPPQDLEMLMEAVQSVSWHQSESATACRWVRVMGLIAAGRMKFSERTRETAESIVAYPNGDLRKVRPSIRAAETGLQNLSPESTSRWVGSFWQESWENTPCIPPEKQHTTPAFDNLLTRSSLNDVWELLIEHWRQTHPSTATEAKHDAVFGMALYCIKVLEEMSGLGISSSTLGRMGLRTILEVSISLTYLNANIQDKLWDKWREYGVGQAKLSVLKYEDVVEPPDYIDLSTIQQIAFEEKGPDFVSINLAGWSGIDLRKMSERVGVKDLYDRHYPVNSGFVHGAWSAVRESVWETCGNPLHRLHRIPSRNSLSESVDSAAELVDGILEQLDVIYPSFPWRLMKRSIGP